MRRSSMLATGLIGITGLALGCSLTLDTENLENINALTVSQQGPPRQNQRVDVDVRCPRSNNVFVTVDPWSVRVRPGYAVLWNLRGDATQVRITPKATRRWPFTGTPPHSGTTSTPASSGAARSNAPLGTYLYTATVTCQIPSSGGGGTVTVTIDPDIIITF